MHLGHAHAQQEFIQRAAENLHSLLLVLYQENQENFAHLVSK